jgi:hypothetical protein
VEGNNEKVRTRNHRRVIAGISPVYAKQDCANDGDTVTLHGTVVQSTSAEDGTMKPKKVLDIALFVPLCMADQEEQFARVELSSISKKWVGLMLPLPASLDLLVLECG